MKLRTLAIVLTVALASAVAYGQSGVYLAFNAQMWDQEGVNTYSTNPGSQNIDRPWIFGPSYGIYYDVTRLPYLGKLKTGPVVFGIDARGETLRLSEYNSSFNEQNTIVSLRVAAKTPIKGFTPFVQAGAGLAHTKVPGRLSYSDNLLYRFGAGVDRKLCKKFDWRVVELGAGAVANYATGYYPLAVGPNQSNYMITLGTGLVFRIH